MSRSVNKVTLVGNLGADPDVKATAGGGKVANLRLATSRRWTDAQGELHEETEWHALVAWNDEGNRLADFAEQYVKKGDKIYIEGRIRSRQYEHEDVQRTAYEIVVRELIPMSGGRGDTA